MNSQVFYRKWRPRNLAEVVGQEPVTQTLRNALISNRISHAYLFCGPRGTGKTSTARILAKALNCLDRQSGEPCDACLICQSINENRSMDIIEIDAASNTSVDDIRDLREKVGYSPTQSRYKVYIIDEVHILSNSASNALLKTLEEPPPHVIFVLATTEAHRLLPTIMSRCQRFDFRRLSQTDVMAQLAKISQAESIKVDSDALRLIARSATGSLRDAENLLEQLTTFYGKEITLKQVQAVLGITGDVRARELVKYIVNDDIGAGVAAIHSVNNDGLDLKQFNRELVEHLRSLLMIKTAPSEAIDLTAEDAAELKVLAEKTPLEHILKAVKLFGQLDFGFDNYSTLPLELALVECALPPEEKKPARHEETAREAKPATAKPAAAAPRPAPAARPIQPVAAKPTPAASTTVQNAPVMPKPQPAPRPATPVAKVTPPDNGAAQPSTTPAAAPTANSQQMGSEIDRLKANWKQIIEQAPPDLKRSPVVAILRSGVRPVSLEKDTVCLSFRHSILKEKIEQIENQHAVEKILTNFLGRSCHVQCVLEDSQLIKTAQKLGVELVDVEEQ